VKEFGDVIVVFAAHPCPRTESKSVGIVAASMPLPVSVTANSIRPGVMSRALISTYPGS